MESNDRDRNDPRILWAKRAIALIAVVLWLALMASIFRSGGGMSAQAPKCLFTTMIVFGILTAIYKGIEAWEKKARK